MSVISVPRRRLLDQVTVEFGPTEFLANTFLSLDRAARERGIHLSLSHDLHELAEVNARNRADWYPLPPMFDPSLGGITPENGFWIYGVNEQGEVVITQAARLYLFADTTFADEWEQRTFIYPEPETQAKVDEYCTVDCAAAHDFTGRVCHTGALWIRSDCRGKGLASLMPRLTRAYSLTRWYPDSMLGLVKTKLVDAGMARTYGWQRIDRSVHWFNAPNYGDLDFAVCWMNPDDVVRDLGQLTQLLDEPASAAA
jgi:hypothetical protein